MTTDKCSYCERDEGLKIFLNRYILSKDLSEQSTISKLNNLEQERNILEGIVSGIKDNSKINSTSLNKNNTADIGKLNTIVLTADSKDSNFYKNVYGSNNVEGFGFKGSILRKGYLYVYMQHLGLNGWQEYEVSESGFLKRINKLNFFKASSSLKNEVSQKNEPCSKIFHRAESLTIVVPKALEASNIYLKYSENQWSQKTREYYKANYTNIMNVFSVQDFLNGSENKGVFPIASGIESFCVDSKSSFQTDELDVNNQFLTIQTVGYNVSKSTKDIKSALSYLRGKDLEAIYNEMPDASSGELSASDYTEKRNYELSSTLSSSSNKLLNLARSEPQNNVAHTKSIFQNLEIEELELALNDQKKMRMLFGALVTIDDPVGVVMDIGSNIANVLVSDTTYTDLEKTAHTLEMLKSNFGINDDPYYNIDEIQEQMKAKKLTSHLNPHGSIVADVIQERWDNNKTEAQLLSEEKERKKIQQKRKQEEWDNKYIQQINKQEFSNSLLSLQQKKKAQASIADALDQLGLEFISKSFLSDHFAYNFEKNNIIDCLILSESVNSILEGVKVGPKMNKYMGKYIYNTGEKDNYFLNFLALNSDEIRKKTNEKINKLSSSNLNAAIATQPFGDLISAYIGFFEKVKSEEIKFTLLSNIARGFLNVTGLMAPNNKKVHPIAPMMISMFTLSEIDNERIHFKSKSDFNTKMRRYYSSHFNLVGQQNKIGNYIKDSEWDKLYQLYEKQKFIDIPKLNIKKDVLNKLPVGLRTAITKHAELLLTKNNEVRIPVFASDVLEEKANTDFLRFFVIKTGIVGLQYWAFKTTFETENTENPSYEITARRSAAVVGLAMSIVEAVGALLNSLSKVKSSSGVLKSLNTFILELTTDNRNIIKGWIWRGFGLVTGVFMGGLDVYNGWNAVNNGEKKFGGFLIASGLSVVIGSAMIFALNPFGWIAILAAIILSLIAYLVQDNEIQRWIRKCLLSLDQSIPRFQSITEQLSGLKLVYR